MQKSNEKDFKFKNGDSGPKYLVNGPRLEVGLLVFRPGQKLGEHFHREVEETFFFFEGRGKFIVNGREYDIIPGDIFKLDPGEKHDIINDTDTDIKAIFIKCPYLPSDKVTVTKNE